jgi:hypothetical protein
MVIRGAQGKPVQPGCQCRKNNFVPTTTTTRQANRTTRFRITHGRSACLMARQRNPPSSAKSISRKLAAGKAAMNRPRKTPLWPFIWSLPVNSGRKCTSRVNASATASRIYKTAGWRLCIGLTGPTSLTGLKSLISHDKWNPLLNTWGFRHRLRRMPKQRRPSSVAAPAT